MHDLRGSVWRKWDLHVHTPDSFVHSWGGNAWDKFLDALEKLPAEFKVIGINDYIFLDGYKKVLEAKSRGRLVNIDLILPVIELRLDKFGGTKSALSRVNYHVVFSNEISIDIIESQFLSALCPKYILAPEHDHLAKSGKWAAVPTRKSVEELGKLIIESVPPGERDKFYPPLIEGFNNLCVSVDAIRGILQLPCFEGKTITAVGKTEWADIKWNDNSIADKKNIINGADLVFISAETADAAIKSRRSLSDGGVNDRLLDCSDAHQFSDAPNKDRLGKCFTWIKADPTFEGFRQAVFEYPTRVAISVNRPIEPLLQIKSARIDFANNTQLQRGERTDVFCFRGKTEITLSPYLTCIIGGRGTGKSTLLNLLHEKLNPGATAFFKDNKLVPTGVSVEAGVSLDGVTEHGVAEFLQQNEIEQFATDHTRLTEAIFVRLRKFDSKNALAAAEGAVLQAAQVIRDQTVMVKTYYDFMRKLAAGERELVTKKQLVESFQHPDYNKLTGDLRALNEELELLRNGRKHLDQLIGSLSSLFPLFRSPEEIEPIQPSAHWQRIEKIIGAIEAAIEAAQSDSAVQTADSRATEITTKIADLRGQVETFLKERGVSAENLSDVGRATERIAQLEQEIANLKRKVDNLATEVNAFVPNRRSADEYRAAVRALLAPINEELKVQGAEVKPIELQYLPDPQAFRESMIEYVIKAIGPVENRAARGDYVESKLEDVNFEALTTKDKLLEKIPEDSTIYSKVLREFFGQDINFELLKLEAELHLLDLQKLGTIHVLYDQKPVESSSFGQRCTAVIVVLLLLGNMPIIIDEPEAHLDSSLIARYLVNLIKTRKNHRQIVFATHNANLVVNGDAELVHCMSMDDSKVTKITSTTIEDLAHRKSLLALEGGKEAFQQREKRYGID